MRDAPLTLQILAKAFKMVCVVEIASFDPPNKAKSAMFSGYLAFVLKYSVHGETVHWKQLLKDEHFYFDELRLPIKISEEIS